MRALVQRVSAASVTVDGEEVGAIGAGLLALVGVTHSDGDAEAVRLAEKLWTLRIFADPGDPEGRMDLPVAAVGGQVLVVSQFTLYGDTRRGRRPSWADGRADPSRPSPSSRRWPWPCAIRGPRWPPVASGPTWTWPSSTTAP